MNKARLAKPALGLLLCTASSLAAQQPARYRSGPDTLWFQSLNVYTMYFVRGADTLGQPVHDLSVERRTWLTGSELRAELWQLSLNVEHKVKVDTLTLSPSGRVLAINGSPPSASPRGRYDALPRLPEPIRALRTGATWTDSIRIEGETATGNVIYAATRRYRVTRELDTLGGNMLEAVAEGEVRYRDGYWADSAAGLRMWIDVNGPVTARMIFDARGGRLVGGEWRMELRGSAGIPREGGGQDTVPAGLRSRDDNRLVSMQRAARLARALGTGDTLVTSTARGRILLHVSSRRADTMAVAMVRNDGMVGTTQAVLGPGGAPRRYEALWTDSTPVEVVHRVEVRGDSVVVRGQASGSHPMPRTTWAVADHAMDELLVPMLLGMPRDGESRPIAIYRPYPNRWDRGAARLRGLNAGALAVIEMEGTREPLVLFFTTDGRLVAAGQGQSERTPQEGSGLRRLMEEMLVEARR